MKKNVLSPWLAVWLILIGVLLSGSRPASAQEPFDADRAMSAIRAQCAFGPRVPGADAHGRALEWLDAQLKQLGMKVRRHPFDVVLPLSGDSAKACNLWAAASADGPTSPAILISAHWDTRPWADREPGGGNPPMLGANDGASGVAMALEIARVLRGDPMFNRLVIAFWDAEDSGKPESIDSWGLGAAAAAAAPPPWINRVVLGINLDMVAGEDLRLRPESISLQCAPDAIGALWMLGTALAPGRFVQGEPQQVIDDHLPWIRAGLPYVDLVGYPARYWHTSGDTPDHCNQEVLGQVGRVVLEYVRGGEWPRHGRIPGLPSVKRPAAPEKVAH